jgi:hypothetical protein
MRGGRFRYLTLSVAAGSAVEFRGRPTKRNMKAIGLVLTVGWPLASWRHGSSIAEEATRGSAASGSESRHQLAVKDEGRSVRFRARQAAAHNSLALIDRHLGFTRKRAKVRPGAGDDRKLRGDQSSEYASSLRIRRLIHEGRDAAARQFRWFCESMKLIWGKHPATADS